RSREMPASRCIAHEFSGPQLLSVAVDQNAFENDEGFAEDMLMRQRTCPRGKANEIEAFAPRLVKIERQPGKPGRRLAVAIIRTQSGPARIDDLTLLVQGVGLHWASPFLAVHAF